VAEEKTMTVDTTFKASDALAIAIAFGRSYRGRFLRGGELTRTDNFYAATDRRGCDDTGGAIMGFVVRNRSTLEVEIFFRDQDAALGFATSQEESDGYDREIGIVILSEEVFVAYTQLNPEQPAEFLLKNSFPES
jgi:uncharacterized cupredoxin-like copper-binding protein